MRNAGLVMATAALGVLSACLDTRGLSTGTDGTPSTGGGSTSNDGGTPGTGGALSIPPQQTGGAIGIPPLGTGGAVGIPPQQTGGAIGIPPQQTGGAIGTGGTPTGGVGGGNATGGIGSAGIPGSGGSTPVPIDGGASKDTAIECPPVCDIYCGYGNQVDANGCKLCKCNPAPIDAMPADSRVCPLLDCPAFGCANGYAKDSNGCDTCRCNPTPTACPDIKCKPCPFGYVKEPNGCDTCTCAPAVGAACTDLTSETACAAVGSRCRWLVRGCTEPSLPATGCYDTALIGCASNCPAGTTCLSRSINPCYNSNCLACGETIDICL